MILFATVLRSGGDFGPGHVRALREQVLRFHPSAGFVCLSDQPIDGVETQDLPRDPPPGYWVKTELFDRDRFPDGTEILYLDLDTVVTGPLLHLVFFQEPYAVAALHGGQFDNLASGVLRYRHPALAMVRDAYQLDPEGARELHSGGFRQRSGRVGDQSLIEACVGRFWISCESLQSGIYRYKRQLKGQGSLPRDARLVVFNGKPRPWDVDEPWLPDYRRFM